MKKVSFVLAAVIAAMCLTTNANAQIGVHVGYNLINHTEGIAMGNSTYDYDPTNLNGFYVNGSYNLEFLSKKWGELSVEPGLTYSFGSKILSSEKTGNISTKELRRDHCLNIPVNIKYAYDIIPGTLKLSAFAGPVLSFGLAANTIEEVQLGKEWTMSTINLYTGHFSTESSKTELNISGNEGDTGYSFFDLRLGIGINATILEKYNVRIGYDIGLLNRTAGMKIADASVKYISHTNIFHVGVGYIF